MSVQAYQLTPLWDIAREAHKGQTRKGGAMYITHIERVTNSLVTLCRDGGDAATSYHVFGAAILHDVLEDNRAYHPMRLVGMGAPQAIVNTVELLSRQHCVACSGKGRVQDANATSLAYSRIRNDYHDVLATGTILNIARLATADITKHCTGCNGGGWGDSYAEYLGRVMQDPIAVTVKRADALDNLHDDPRTGMPKKYEMVLEALSATPGAFGEVGVPTLRDGQVTY